MQLSSYSSDEKLRAAIITQLQNSKELYKFLEWHLTEAVDKNAFSGVYGAKRAFNDGQAEFAKSLLELLSNLNTLKVRSHDK